MRRSLPLLCGVLVLGCASAPQAARVPTAVVEPDLHECPRADAIIENIKVTSRSSLEIPLQRAAAKPYDDWTEYDRGVASKFLELNFGPLDEAAIFNALFTDHPARQETEFRQWMQLRGFSPGLVTFLLKNYTHAALPEMNRSIRNELARGYGGRRFQNWLEIASTMDPSPDLTRYVLELHLAHDITLTTGFAGAGCRYGAWCHAHLSQDLTPEETVAYIRQFADQDRDIGSVFLRAAELYAVDPAGIRADAVRPDMRGLTAARLLMESGAMADIEGFLRDAEVPGQVRAFWAHRLALDPPAESAAMLRALRNDPALPQRIREAISAPGTVQAPYTSCAERVELLAQPES